MAGTTTPAFLELDPSQPVRWFSDLPVPTPGVPAPVHPHGPGKKPLGPARAASQKRRCISTACIACRKRKSKCDGALPSCAACASVHGTECVYDPNSDHRRKGVYREKVDSSKARNSTLQILIEAIINAPEEEVLTIVNKIRECDNLDDAARQISAAPPIQCPTSSETPLGEDAVDSMPVQGETDLARKMGELRLEKGSVRFIGGTSHLIYLGEPAPRFHAPTLDLQPSDSSPISSWTTVTSDVSLVAHLISMYFNYHYAYFTILSRSLFWRDFIRGKAASDSASESYCSPLLVNAMLALGCHFTDVPGAYASPGDSKTKGDHFFAEAKSLILAGDEFAKSRLVTVQALALMSVREAGCAREAEGWVYSGMSFRMAQDLGLNLDISGPAKGRMGDEEVDARKMTFWGCFLIDKCWSNYLGRLPQLPRSSSSISKPDVFPDEEAAPWCPLTDKGYDESYRQPSRTRVAASLLSSLSEISSDLLIFFYHPSHIGRSRGKSAELKKLGEIHQRLEEWRRQLPKEFEPKEGQLPNVILMHMFFHLQYIHLFRPFLKYTPTASPLPAHVSPRRICTANAGAISKLMRLYKKTYNLRQICNIAVYMTHSACTIHLLNLPEKSARRDIIHGVRHLEEIADDWLCARRTLCILSVISRKWKCDLPEEALSVLQRADDNYGSYSVSEVPSPKSSPQTPTIVSADGPGFKPHPKSSPPNLLGHFKIENRTLPLPSVKRPPLATPQQQFGEEARLSYYEQQPASYEDEQTGCARSGVLEGWVNQEPGNSNSGFDSPALPVGEGCLMAEGGGPLSNATGSVTSPQQGFGINGQHWILNDSAKWHHNFEGWENISGALADDGVAMFDGRQNGVVQQASVGATDHFSAGFDDPRAPLSGAGWLPGLD